MSNNSFSPKQMNYEIFIIILTLLSWANFFLFFLVTDQNSQYVIIGIEQVLTIFFLLDFTFRLKKAEARTEYFKKYGWLDLIGSFPFLRWLRAFRVYKTIQYLGEIQGRRIFKEFFANRAETAALTITLAIIFLFEFASIFILMAEEGASDATIISASDAVWWVLVTVATVGYGDMYPVTSNGRFIALFVIVAGVGLFGILSGFLTRSFLGKQPENNGGGQPDDSNPQLNQILATLQEIKQMQQADRLDRESADAKLQARLAAVEKLLDTKKLDEG
jgi:voltage-gated potassium channel